MNVLQSSPPPAAVRLFNEKDLSNWTTRDGKKPGWKIEGGELHVVPGTGDIQTTQQFRDFFLHIEFRCPAMPDASGQGKGNSGVFLQGRYEIQVLDSHGWEKPGLGDCGGIYNQFAPLTNACRPAMEWQTYDVFFRAPRCDGEKLTEPTRLTVVQNGTVIHNNIALPGVTGAPIDEKVWEPGPLLLQDHGDLVSYRNIWIVELPEKGSETYEPH